MNGIEIGIVDTRNIIRLINEVFYYDFTDYALTSFKRRLENIIILHNLKYPDALQSRLREDKSFFDTFLHEILVEPTEMFRDPSVWRLLHDEYLPKLASTDGHFRIWLPMAVSGEELFTLLVVLKEKELLDSAEITVTCLSNKSMHNIQRGVLKLNRIEVSQENYEHFHGLASLEKYYNPGDTYASFDESLIKIVTFAIQDLNFENSPKSMDLILFRNQMLYFNQTLQDKIAGILYDSLAYGGYLLAGIREKILCSDESRVLRLIDEDESIYQKK
jgi:chemotaxis protein methyltransferase CheR